MKKTAWIKILFLASLTLVFFACKPTKKNHDVVKTVKVATASAHGENRAVSFPGKVKAASEVNLAFRISGPIVKANVSEGDFVKQGDVLAEMDARDYAIQLSATEAEYKQVKSEAERIIRLYEKQSVSENDYDKAVAGLRQITAKYNAHKNALEDTKLLAPFDGYVQKKYVDKNETIGAGMPVFSMISATAPEVQINIPASEYILRDKFDAFSCTFDVFPNQVFPLDFISVTQKANMNQLYTVRLKVRNDAQLPMPSPGMSTMVSIRFKPENTEQVAIPINAIFEVDGVSTVWVYDEAQEKVFARKVKVSEILTDGTIVISKGLKVGEQVVSAGVHSLSDAQQVKLLTAVSSSNVGGLL